MTVTKLPISRFVKQNNAKDIEMLKVQPELILWAPLFCQVAPDHVLPAPEEIYVYSPLGTACKIDGSTDGSGKNSSIVTMYVKCSACIYLSKVFYFEIQSEYWNQRHIYCKFSYGLFFVFSP